MHVNIDVEKPFYRFLVLFFNCMLTFGSFYCFDIPSMLQDDMQQDFSCNGTTNVSCCYDCLGMSPSQYNLLYAVYSWTSACVVLGTGFFIDKCGNQIAAFIFSLLSVIGSSVFALGTFYKGSEYFLPLMLLGRLLFASGNGSIIRASLCGVGLISSVFVGLLDVYGFKKLGVLDKINSDSKNVKVSDVRHFSASYWLMVLTIVFFYSSVFPFVADASKFIKDKYHIDENSAAYIAGSIYDVSLFLSPFLGGLIDVFGKRGILTIVCAVATVPVFGLLAFSNVHPLVSTLWLGITYSLGSASLFPSISLIVPQATVGTAMGIASSLQMLGIGFSNLIVGKILETKGDMSSEATTSQWRYVMVFLLGNILACVITSITLNVIDTRRNGVLNMSRKEAKKNTEECDIGEDGIAPGPLEGKHERY